MRGRDQSITVQGVLSLVAIGAMLFYAAYALQLGPHPSMAAYTQEESSAVSSPSGGIASATPDQVTPGAPSSLYTGTVEKHGSSFLLRGATGALYDLDDPLKAQPFAGETVTVIGKLNETAKLIHVERIEKMRA